MVTVKTSEEIKIMAEGGKILSKIMRELKKKVRSGIITEELEILAEDLILKSGGQCSFKGYDGFPNCLCVSLNEVIVHSIPSKRTLKEGDILSLDLGIQFKGFHTDMAITVPVGKVSEQAKKLIKVTREALEVGKKAVKPGMKIGDISFAIQQYVEGENFNVVRQLCGHGIGRKLHEDPQILNFVDKKSLRGDEDLVLQEGMAICIEPMVTVGSWKLKKSADNSGFETEDGSLSCHFEQTIAVTKTGHKVLTEF